MTERFRKCKYIHHLMGDKMDESHCFADRKEGGAVRKVTEADCASCGKYKSRYIEYPITVTGIENSPFSPRYGAEAGSPCEVSPCGEEYGGKTYLGIYLGELPFMIHTTYDPESGIIRNTPANNPAIFVPELKKIIFGIESWWRIIEKPEDFRGISQDDIESTWYVQLLRGMDRKDAPGGQNEG